MVGTNQFSDLKKILIRKFQEMIWGVWKPYSGWFLIPETSVWNSYQHGRKREEKKHGQEALHGNWKNTVFLFAARKLNICVSFFIPGLISSNTAFISSERQKENSHMRANANYIWNNKVWWRLVMGWLGRMEEGGPWPWLICFTTRVSSNINSNPSLSMGKDLLRQVCLNSGVGGKIEECTWEAHMANIGKAVLARAGKINRQLSLTPTRLDSSPQKYWWSYKFKYKYNFKEECKFKYEYKKKLIHRQLSHPTI